jgi:predicted transcriptional regulator
MARLCDGEREERQETIFQLLRRFIWGARESEIAVELGWERRTVNNYLRGLEDDGKAYKEGRSWFAE